MRIVFCGTPGFAVPSLQRLIAEPDFKIEAVITQPDRPRGRGKEIAISAVKTTALAANLPVFQPERIRSEESYDFLRNLAPDAVVIIAYGQIVPKKLIELPRLGWINVHASLLPKYRGAAPINWAILNGEERTGVTTMQIDAGLDTGPMLLKRELDIAPDETAPELTARLSELGALLIIDTLRKLRSNDIVRVPQDSSLATFAPPLKKEDGRIDWSRPAMKIYNRIRALQPWPRTFTVFRGQLCHVWGRPTLPDGEISSTPGSITREASSVFVACGEGSLLRLEHVQFEGRKRVSAHDFVNGARLQPGESFAP